MVIKDEHDVHLRESLTVFVIGLRGVSAELPAALFGWLVSVRTYSGPGQGGTGTPRCTLRTTLWM
jgi:hypothetical protein